MNLVTLRTFTYPTESFLAKAKLESEGIYCQLKDELTIQVDNFLSNAIGGVKLQVMEKDYDRADKILESQGYPKGIPTSPSKIEIFFLNKRNRKRIVVFLISLPLILAIFFLLGNGINSLIPEKKPIFPSDEWHLSHFSLNGQKFYPKTKKVITPVQGIGSKFKYVNDTQIYFLDDEISIPGFDSWRTFTKWDLDENLFILNEIKKTKTPYEEYIIYLENLQREKELSNQSIEEMKQDYISHFGDNSDYIQELNVFESQLPLELLMHNDGDTLKLESENLVMYLTK